MNILFKFVFVFVGLVTPLLSVSAPPFPFEIEQPDGSKIPVRLFGHEYYNWMETEDGYVIDWVEDDDQLGWFYSKLDEDGKFTSSEILVTFPAPYDLYIPKRLREISPTVRDLNYRLPNNTIDFHNHLDRGMLDNTLKPLVFLVEFPDEDHTYTEEHFEYLLFEKDLFQATTIFPPGHEDYTMSVRDYYDEISNGKQEIIGNEDSIIPWKRAENNYDDYVDGVGGTADGVHGYAQSAAALVVETAMRIDAEGIVDFSQFENEKGFIDVVILIVSGEGGPQNGNYFWPHMFYVPTSGNGLEDIDKQANSNSDGYFSVGDVAIHKYIVIQEQYAWDHIGTGIGMLHPIGTICHELGHVLGLPDLYDNSDIPAAGIGEWGLMGSGNYRTQTSPAYMSAWSRYRLGFIDPDTLSNVYNLEITIPPASDSPGKAYILPMSSDFSQEYLMIENRQKERSDKNLIKSGLLVWHIDETITGMYPVFSGSVNRDPYFYGVNLLQADGYGDLYSVDGNRGDAGDPFPGNTSEITSITNPNTSLYTYDRDADGISDTGGSSNIRLTDIKENSDNSITLTAYNPNRGILIAYDEAGYAGWGIPAKSGITWAGIRMVAPENSILSGISTVFPSDGSVREYTINIWKGWEGNMPETLLSPLNGIVNWSTDPDNIRNGGWANISVSDANIILDEGETYYVEIHLEGSEPLYPLDYERFAYSEPSGMSYGRSDTQENCQSLGSGDWNIRVSLNPDFCNADCIGTCNGIAEFDNCGVCGGDGNCDAGCMDTDACNYFAEATFDDGSCIFAEQNHECGGSCAVAIDCVGECGGNAVIDECGQCNGPGAIYECGCLDIDEDVSCDCDGNILDCDGICGGGNVDCYMSITTNLIPENFSLYQNYPNPFNPITNITYGIPEYTNVQIIIFDLSGKQVASLINDFQSPGYYSINWNANSHPSGMYFVKMIVGDYVNTQKLMLVK